LPEESLEFVKKIEKIFEEVKEKGEYTITISSKNNPLIDEFIMAKLDDGIDLYVDYLKSGVAENLDNLRKMKNKIIIEAVGGCAYRTLNRVLDKLNIDEKFVWNNTEEDPFFHSIGKYDEDPKGNKVFYDYSVDATVISTKPTGEIFFPVINSLHYERILDDCPLGTPVLITDPDHDRLTICQIESSGNINTLDEVGISYIKLNEDKILTVYTANQAFLMLMDFRTRQLKLQNKWKNHPRFMIKTTASALSWDEWARHNDVKVVNVPVGFKEIANIMKKVELKLKTTPYDNVLVDDVFGNTINLGISPRLVFAGEESGGMIMGAEDMVKSLTGREAIAMREKSATEAIIVASALLAKLEQENKTLSQYLIEVFDSNNITSKFDTRVDISYYNESEPDIVKLKQSKIEGEKQRTKNDLFFLSLAIAVREGIATLDNVKDVLNNAFDMLNFTDLKNIKFVGDGTYLEFSNKYIEIRPSGTDAKTKAYGGGLNLEEISKYAKILGNYSGDRTELHKNLIPEDFYNNSKDIALDHYLKFVDKDANNEQFVIPEYKFQEL